MPKLTERPNIGAELVAELARVEIQTDEQLDELGSLSAALAPSFAQAETSVRTSSARSRGPYAVFVGTGYRTLSAGSFGGGSPARVAISETAGSELLEDLLRGQGNGVREQLGAKDAVAHARVFDHHVPGFRFQRRLKNDNAEA